jgi:undecaprenyl-diphosphatase
VLGPVDSSFSFPSGHTLNSTVFFVTLAGLLWVGLRSYLARTALAVVAVVMSAGIGLSRVYLGYHWATDVLAGWTVAVTWLALVSLVAYFSRPQQQLEAGPSAGNSAGRGPSQ